jgi:pimeloyl-ACP methyl ester carboxylesterase
MTATDTRYLDRPDGRIAYDDRGAGPLVVCVPGMGDTRDEYRALTPRLTAAGFRVVTMDLRGHGESDASFPNYERADVGDDVLALLAALDAGPAHLVGTSFGAAAVVWAAAHTPVRSVTLIGPFVRDVPPPAWQRLALRVLFARPWGARAWSWWYGRLNVGTAPDDLDDHRQRLRDNLGEPGRLEALQAMARAGASDIDPLLDDLTRDNLVIMGDGDPDFPDPAAEAATIAARTGGRVEMVAETGHYPHAQRPDHVAVVLTRFFAATAVA